MIEFQNVRIGENGITELDGSKISLQIPRDEIERIEVRRGSESKHPILQSLLGVALIGWGLTPVPHILDWIEHGGEISHYTVLIVAFVIVGGWLVYDALRRKLLLYVITTRGHKKIGVRGSPLLSELDQLLADANREYGYSTVPTTQTVQKA